MGIKEELHARAKFENLEAVRYQGKKYKVWVRFWRRSEDAFYYMLRECDAKGWHPHMPKRVPEEELTAWVEG